MSKTPTLPEDAPEGARLRRRQWKSVARSPMAPNARSKKELGCTCGHAWEMVYPASGALAAALGPAVHSQWLHEDDCPASNPGGLGPVRRRQWADVGDLRVKERIGCTCAFLYEAPVLGPGRSGWRKLHTTDCPVGQRVKKSGGEVIEAAQAGSAKKTASQSPSKARAASKPTKRAGTRPAETSPRRGTRTPDNLGSKMRSMPATIANELTAARAAVERTDRARDKAMARRADAIAKALAAGHTQAEVATALGISQQMVAKIARQQPR